MGNKKGKLTTVSCVTIMSTFSIAYYAAGSDYVGGKYNSGSSAVRVSP